MLKTAILVRPAIPNHHNHLEHPKHNFHDQSHLEEGEESVRGGTSQENQGQEGGHSWRQEYDLEHEDDDDQQFS